MAGIGDKLLLPRIVLDLLPDRPRGHVPYDDKRQHEADDQNENRIPYDLPEGRHLQRGIHDNHDRVTVVQLSRFVKIAVFILNQVKRALDDLLRHVDGRLAVDLLNVIVNHFHNIAVFIKDDRKIPGRIPQLTDLRQKAPVVCDVVIRQLTVIFDDIIHHRIVI